jgi:hypothetical protein
MVASCTGLTGWSRWDREYRRCFWARFRQPSVPVVLAWSWQPV